MHLKISGNTAVLLSLLCYSNYVINKANGENPIALTKQGKVMGSVMTSTNGQLFLAFRGIPYAQPPVGALRFKVPQPAESWNDIFNATTDPIECPQFLNDGDTYSGVEDCLKISVYTHKLPKNSNDNKSYPVIVYIHGGSFTYGSAKSTYTHPEMILNQDIVFVVPGYRLGPLGFLSTGDQAAPGNYALLDQVLALKWVQQNIASFGGDPQRVTLSGFSAGAIAVGFHLISPITAGLFRSVIMMSGPTLGAQQLQEDPLKYASLLGQQLNCTMNNTIALVNCLQKQSAEDLIVGNKQMQGYTPDSSAVPFGVVVEDPTYGQFLLDSPVKLFTEGKFHKVPIMTGNNLNEGATFFQPSSFNYLVYLPFITRGMLCYFFKNFMPSAIQYMLEIKTNLVDISFAFKKKYGTEADWLNKSKAIQYLVDLIGDSSFKAPTDLLARLVTAQNVPVYLYSFEYVGKGGNTTVNGKREVDHEDGYYYLLNPLQANKEDVKMSSTLGCHWRNFAYTGKPTNDSYNYQWTAVPSPPPKELPNLRYGTHSTAMQKEFFTEKMYFWNTKVPQIAAK